MNISNQDSGSKGLPPPVKLFLAIDLILGLAALVWGLSLVGNDTLLLIGVLLTFAGSWGIAFAVFKAPIRNLTLTISGILGFGGFALCIGADMAFPTRTVQLFQEMVASWSGLTALILVVIFLLPLSRHTSKSALFATTLSAILWLSASSLSIWGGMILVNGLFDDESTIDRKAKVIDKERFSDGKRADHYLVFQDWQHPGKLHRIQVRKNMYESTSKNDIVILEMKPGYLGYEWVYGYKKKYDKPIRAF